MGFWKIAIYGKKDFGEVEFWECKIKKKCDFRSGIFWEIDILGYRYFLGNKVFWDKYFGKVRFEQASTSCF